MQSGQTPAVITLSSSLTVDRAAALKEELSAALESNENVVLNIAQVEEIDLSCLQVLYAAGSTAKAKGKGLHFIGAAPAKVAKRLASCGFLRVESDRAEAFEAALVGFQA
jgi:anti-anti-sigma regulatory factor